MARRRCRRGRLRDFVAENLYITGRKYTTDGVRMTDFRARVFGYHQKAHEEEDFSVVLERIPIFADLSKRELAAVARVLHRREYLPNEPIIRQDEPGLGMYIIQTGRAAVVSEPGEIQLSELSDGDFFGEVSLLDETPRSATVVARTHCVIFGFFQSDLFSLIERNPRFGVKIVVRVARIIGDRLRKANQQVQALTGDLRRARGGDARMDRP
jgi:CRP/FNR family cyclic AMP-dependent transcriptional regulator